jgi:rhodanese-related sulfurtransferase
MNKQILVFFVVLGVLLAGCQSKSVEGKKVDVAGSSYQNVTPNELNTMLKDKHFVFVNVHIPFAGNIAQTDLSIAYDQIEQNLSQLPSDKNAKIVLYCRSGHMSQIAAEKMVSLGYTNVWNLSGGIAAWEQAGYELEK